MSSSYRSSTVSGFDLAWFNALIFRANNNNNNNNRCTYNAHIVKYSELESEARAVARWEKGLSEWWLEVKCFEVAFEWM